MRCNTQCGNNIMGGLLLLLLTCFTPGQATEQEIKVEFEETLGGMVEAMTEIQGRADAMMEEIKTREELLRELGRELEQTVGEVEGVQQMLARMELEKMGLQEETMRLKLERRDAESRINAIDRLMQERDKDMRVEEKRLVKVKEEVTTEDAKLKKIKKQMVERLAERERLERQVKERKEEVALAELKLTNMTSLREEAEASSPFRAVQPILLPAFGISVLLNMVTAVSLGAAIISPFPPPPASKRRADQHDRLVGRPPAPSVPPPGWDELLPKEEQSLLWQDGDSKEELETWHKQQIEDLPEQQQEQQDIIWQQPESTVWPDQNDVGDGWQGGYGPLTVQAGMVVGASDENGFRQFLEDEIAGLRPEE